MSIENKRDDVFYLGIHKDTGQLIDFVPPAGKDILLHPRQVLELSLSGKAPTVVVDQLEKFNEKIKTNALPTGTVTFVDKPGNTICAGSINGIPFCYEC